MMDEYVENLIKQLEQRAQEFDRIEQLIYSPEIIADNRLYLRLSAKLNSLFKSKEYLHQILNADNKLEVANQIAKQLNITSNNDALLILKPLSANACEFCLQIAQMYTNFAKLNGLNAEYNPQNALNGIKSATILIENGFDLLKGENGFHKGEQGEVSVLITKNPTQTQVNLNQNDIKIDLFHSSGAGGQNVNKVQSAVRLTHIPTQISIVCQDNRSQLQNKEQAHRLLLQKVQKFYLSKQESEYRAHKKLQTKNLKRVRLYDSSTVACTITGQILPLKQVLKGEIDLFLCREEI